MSGVVIISSCPSLPNQSNYVYVYGHTFNRNYTSMRRNLLLLRDWGILHFCHDDDFFGFLALFCFTKYFGHGRGVLSVDELRVLIADSTIENANYECMFNSTPTLVTTMT